MAERRKLGTLEVATFGVSMVGAFRISRARDEKLARLKRDVLVFFEL